ncbi:MAG: SIR2 family protein [Elusimicrobia bacterium]|nr:SIR2 family protein [Elusimicrobiota bacterium]
MAEPPAPEPRIELFNRGDIDAFPRFQPEKDDKRLFEAIKDQELIVFYGAGVSQLAGCASWTGLANRVIGAFGSTIYSDLDKTVLGELATVDPRKAISICCSRVKGDPTLEQYYYGAIKEAVTPGDAAAFANIHEQLFKLYPVAFVTTNIDKGMQSIPPQLLEGKKVINLTVDEIDAAAELRDGNVFYLHGSIDDLPKAILTTDQYIDYYFKPKAHLERFLREVFSGKYCVLFLGYSLSEYEILQNIYHASKAGDGTQTETRHFLLTPIYSRDIAKFNIEKGYFRIFSVRAIPYFIDHEGYLRLNYVLRELRKEIEASSATTLDLMREIDGV